jgi:hypothetical protein
VTYRTRIGQVLKKADCFLDPDTTQIETDVEDRAGGKYLEVNTFIDDAADQYKRD